MRKCVVVLAILALVQLAVGQADDKQKALDELRGIWKVVKAEPIGGEGVRLVFAGEKLTFDGAEGTIKLDPKAKPAHIDMIRDQKMRYLGIYQVSGDMLQICLAFKGDQRPTEFKATENHGLLRLKRDPVTDAEKKEAERLGGVWHVTSASFEGVSPPWMDLKDRQVMVKGQEWTDQNLSQQATVFFRVGNDPPVRRPVLKTILTVDLKAKRQESPPIAFRLDVNTKPKQIDLQAKEGVLPVTRPGIYSLENDQLQVALAGHRADRPTDLTADAKRDVLVLTRKKPDLETHHKASRAEQERLKGAWTVESGGYDTAKLSEKDLKGFRLVFGDDGVKWEEAGAVEALTVQLDPQAKPAGIDLTVAGGAHQGKTIRGIYQFDKDRLLLRLPPSFSIRRARDFKEGLTKEDAVLILKRDNP